MNEFEYVMVLISIIMGIGIAHILLGFGGLLDRFTATQRSERISWAHSAWLARVFFWMVMFWWWEFRFAELAPEWTVGLYLFLVGYAVVLFLLAVVLVPRSWEGIGHLDDFFLERRAWFYSLLLTATVMDFVDTYLKGGWEYLADSGPWVWAYFIATIPAVVIGIRSEKARHHALMGFAFFLNELGIALNALPNLGF